MLLIILFSIRIQEWLTSSEGSLEAKSSLTTVINPLLVVLQCLLLVSSRLSGSCTLPLITSKQYWNTLKQNYVANLLTQLHCHRYMHYFSSFGYLEESWEMVLGFFVASFASTLVESHPLSTVLDDNLTVGLATLVVGSFVFQLCIVLEQRSFYWETIFTVVCHCNLLANYINTPISRISVLLTNQKNFKTKFL